MEERIYHGKITPKDFAQALMGEFNRSNYRAQSFGSEKSIVIQIVTRQWLETGGQTALSVTLNQVEDGVAIQIGKQAWLGVAASLGLTLFTAMRNPWNVLGRLDDLAQDIQSIQLTEDVNAVIERTAQSMNATFELSERLKRMICIYCNTANPVGTGTCMACGAPLGKVQPKTCSNCGFVLKPTDKYCINCGRAAG